MVSKVLLCAQKSKHHPAEPGLQQSRGFLSQVTSLCSLHRAGCLCHTLLQASRGPDLQASPSPRGNVLCSVSGAGGMDGWRPEAATIPASPPPHSTQPLDSNDFAGRG